MSSTCGTPTVISTFWERGDLPINALAPAVPPPSGFASADLFTHRCLIRSVGVVVITNVFFLLEHDWNVNATVDELHTTENANVSVNKQMGAELEPRVKRPTWLKLETRYWLAVVAMNSIEESQTTTASSSSSSCAFSSVPQLKVMEGHTERYFSGEFTIHSVLSCLEATETLFLAATGTWTLTGSCCFQINRRSL